MKFFIVTKDEQGKVSVLFARNFTDVKLTRKEKHNWKNFLESNTKNVEERCILS